MPSKKPKVMVYLEPDRLEALKKWAASEQRSVNNLIAVLIYSALDEHAKKNQDSES